MCGILSKSTSTSTLLPPDVILELFTLRNFDVFLEHIALMTAPLHQSTIGGTLDVPLNFHPTSILPEMK